MTGGRYLAMLVLLTALTPPVGCQESGPRRAGFGLSFAVTEYQIRDEALNPLRHRGTSLSFGVFRQGGSDDRHHRARFSLLVAPLGDRYSTEGGSLVIEPEVDFHMRWRLTGSERETSFFLGGTTGWSTHWAFYEPWDEAHVYWLTSTWIGVDALLERRLGRARSLALEVEAPLLALVSRPPREFAYREVNPDMGWMVREIHGGTRLASPGEHLALGLGLTYSDTAKGSLGRAVFLRTEIVRNTAPSSRPVNIVTYSLGASVPWPF